MRVSEFHRHIVSEKGNQRCAVSHREAARSLDDRSWDALTIAGDEVVGPLNTTRESSGHKTDTVFSRYNTTSGEDIADAAKRIEEGASAALFRLNS